MNLNNERTPLLGARQESNKGDIYANASIGLGLALFAGLVGSVIVRLPLTVFTFHPVFMTFFIILVTEGIALLQPTTTSQEKEKGLKHHKWIQSASYLSAIFGVSFIFYNKIISGKPHFESVHGKLGLFVFIYLFVQVVFGATIALIPVAIYGSVDRAKSLWKYHRVFGYTLLLFIWTTAQLGVRADYMYNNLYSTHLIYLHWVSCILVFAGIVYRTRISKWGYLTIFN